MTNAANKTAEVAYDALNGSAKAVVDAGGVFYRKYLQPHFKGATLRSNLEEFFINKGFVVRENGEIKRKPQIGRFIKTDYGYHIILKLYPGLCLQKINRVELEAALNAETDAWVDNSGWAHLKVYTRHIPQYYAYRPDLAAEIKKYDCAIPIGIARQGYVMLDMSRDENFALLIGGMPGFGKSQFLTQAITAAVMNYRPDQVQLYLCDLKNGVEFEKFQAVPHLLDWAGELAGVNRILKAANAELNRRAGLMRKARVTNTREYNHGRNHKLAHILAVVDEYADLGSDEKALVTRLCRMGRFAGVHPVVCTQRPSYSVLPGDTKALMPVTLCFKTRNELNSKMILGEGMPHAAYVRGKGRAILLTHRLRQVQVMHLPPKEAAEIVRKRYPQAVKPEVKRAVSW